ncbi:MAG: glycosyltransferase [bacterium]|nr:glycosyltransferase [bacterium]
MKLAFLGPTYPQRGGIARYGTCLLGALQQRHICLGIGFNKLYPSILFPGKGQMELGDLPEGGAQAQPLLHYANPLTWLQAHRLITDHQPQSLVLTWWIPFWALHLGWLQRRLPPTTRLIILCHNVLPHENRLVDARLTKWALKPANRFIVHSEENRSQLLNWFPAAKVIRREHPIYSYGNSNLPSRETARQKLGVSGKLLLFIGFVRHYKGVDVAIRALAKVTSELPDLKLWIAGEFWESAEPYHRLVNELNLSDRVKIEPGYLPEEDMVLRVAASDGMILPYRSATGSGALATAYALDRPVIATRCGCFNEMVIPEQTGLLADPGDVDSLASAIKEFYSGAGPDRFNPGVLAINQKFTWDAIVDAIEELTLNE